MSKSVPGEYLSAFRSRMEQLNRDAHLAPDTYVEPEKVVVQPYVDLYFDVPKERDATSLDESPGRKVRRYRQLRLAAVLASDPALRHVVLLGDPGAGKSVALRRLGIQLAEQAEGGGAAAVIPVYVPLGIFTSELGPDAGRSALTETLRRAVELGSADEAAIAPHLEQLMRDGRLAVLFDGMDEMPRRDFVERLDALADFVDRNRSSQFVFACRTNDFMAAHLPLAQVRIAPFGRRQIRRFLALSLELDAARSKLWARRLLGKESPLAAVATNPLFLTLLVAYVAQKERLPQSQAEIFRAFIDPRIEAAIAHDELDAAEVATRLGAIALAMTEDAGVGTTVPVQTAVEAAGLTEEVGRDVLDIARLAGFVRLDESTQRFRFLHHRLQEFFSALALMAVEPAERDERLWMHVDDAWWAEIFLLLANMGHDLDPMVERVLSELAASSSGGGELAGAKHEMRLILVGQLLEAAANPLPDERLDSLAELLAVRFRSDGKLRGLRKVRVLRALRGPLARHPGSEGTLRVALGSEDGWVQEEAFRAVSAAPASQHGVAGQLIRRLYQESVRRSYPLRYASYLRVARDEPRLAFLTPHIHGAAILHIVVTLLVLASSALLGAGIGVIASLLEHGAVSEAFVRDGAIAGGVLGGILYAVVLYRQWRSGQAWGMALVWAKLLATCVLAGVVAGLLDVLLGLGVAAATGDGWWIGENLLVRGQSGAALWVPAFGLAFGVWGLVTGEIWTALRTRTDVLAFAVGGGAAGWLFHAFGASDVGGVTWATVFGMLPWVLGVLAVSGLMGLAPSWSTLRRGWRALRRRVREGDYSVDRDAVAGFMYGVGVLALILAGIAAAAWAISFPVEALTEKDTGSLGDRVGQGFAALVTIIIVVGVVGFVGRRLFLGARRVRSAVQRRMPSGRQVGAQLALRRLASLSDTNRAVGERAADAESLQHAEPPTAVLVELLVGHLPSGSPGRLEGAVARTVDALQIRLRREAKKPLEQRLGAELVFLAAAKDAVSRSQHLNDGAVDAAQAVLVSRHADDAAAVTLLRSLEADPALGAVSTDLLTDIVTALDAHQEDSDAPSEESMT